jgi:xanthine dehydrogenase YagS FAD-binding subunit
MHNVDLLTAATPGEASHAAATEGALILAGGTDLIPLIKENIYEPHALVSLNGGDELRRIGVEGDTIRIGSMVTLSEIARSVEVRSTCRALAEACRLAASTQLRNMGTLGGNLMQQTRCWYYRGPAKCWLKGGTTCFARDGENELHSVFQTRESPCVSAHPSDPAAALMALGARVRYIVGDRTSEIAIEDLYRLPDEGNRGFWTLPREAVITDVIIPGSSHARRSTYRKGMARAAWSFALAGVAICLDDDMARIALSGVAPIPMRATEAEQYLSETGLGNVDREELGRRLVAGAQPLSENAYKLRLLKGLTYEALERLQREG